MSEFDPTAVFQMAKILESGSIEERLELVARLDVSSPVSSGILLRALEDREAGVRLAALRRLDQAGVRPVDSALGQLLADEDDEVAALAASLQDRPETLNPLEQLIPDIERMADSLGPLGSMLKGMTSSLRDIGSTDERTQLKVIARLETDGPTVPLVIQEGLRSPHLSVRLAALRKAAQCPTASVPETVISEFSQDPNDEVREAADLLVKQGKVGAFDPDAFRGQAAQSMLSSLGGMGDLGDLSAMFGGAPPVEPEDVVPAEEPAPTGDSGGLPPGMGSLQDLLGNIDMSQIGQMFSGESGFDMSKLMGMFGPEGPDMSKLMGMFGSGGPDLSSLGSMFGPGGPDLSKMGDLFGGGAAPDPTTRPQPGASPHSAQPAAAQVPHVIDGWIYVVGDQRLRDRLSRALEKASGGPDGAQTDHTQIVWQGTPPRWAFSLLEAPSASPGWVERLRRAGLELDAGDVALADQARRVSEQVWGAAYADHSLEVPVTLVFHDGMLSRADWGGPEPGACSGGGDALVGVDEGPTRLLMAFLTDPTDDALTSLPDAAKLFEV